MQRNQFAERKVGDTKAVKLAMSGRHPSGGVPQAKQAGGGA